MPIVNLRDPIFDSDKQGLFIFLLSRHREWADDQCKYDEVGFRHTFLSSSSNDKTRHSFMILDNDTGYPDPCRFVQLGANDFRVRVVGCLAELAFHSMESRFAVEFLFTPTVSDNA